MFVVLIKTNEKMSNLFKLQKEAKLAPKFILMAFNDLTGNYVFAADSDKCSETLTENECNALQFSYGFDNEEIKENGWRVLTGFEFLAVAV